MDAHSHSVNPTRMSLVDGPIAPTLLRLALPSVIAMFAQSAMHVSDAYFLGQTGRTTLAGAALVFPMLMLSTMLSAGAVGGGIAGSVARALGSGDRLKAENILRHAMVIALIASALFTLVFLAAGRDVYAALGGSGEALAEAVSYSNFLFCGIAALWLFNILSSVLRGTGRMTLSAVSVTAVTAIQIPVSGMLVLGFGPFPALGIVGAALATVLAYGIGAVCLLIYFLSGNGGLRLVLRGPLRSGIFTETLRTGGIAAVNPFLTVAAVLIINAVTGRIGESVLAGYGIGARLEFLMIPIIFGIGAALITMVGANIGAGLPHRAARICWTGAFTAAALTGAIGLVAALFSSLWVDRFTDDPAVAEACRRYLQTVGPFYGFFGLGLALYFASHGLGSILRPILGGMVRLAVIGGGCAWLQTQGEITPGGAFTLIAAGMVAFGGFTALSMASGPLRRRRSGALIPRPST